MCDDHQLSRRSFLHGTAAVIGGAALLPDLSRVRRRLPLRSPARPQDSTGNSAYSMAMHIHSSFSEQDGSMQAQLYQATANAVDVLWWTDHDHRMDGIGYRDVVHFTSLTKEQGAAGQGKAWDWQQVKSGPLASSGTGGGIVTHPCSPNDPVAGGSLNVTAASLSTSPASFGFYANCKPARWNYRDNLTGQSLMIDVMLNPGWSHGYLQLLIGTSYHEASAGRPAGNYFLSYQIVPATGQPGTSTAQGDTGIVTVPVTADGQTWTTVTITPSNDIANLWPDLDYRDFALWNLTLNAVSTGDPVAGYFDYLQFDRTISGEAFLDQQQSMGSALATAYPAVTQQQGLEVSLQLPHINWFGGNVVLPDYPSSAEGNSAGYTSFLRSTVIPQIHADGGLASYNHPYGYSDISEQSQAQQNTLLQQVATLLLRDDVLGCDLLEVGYNLREGVDLNHHIGLWDVMSRNAVFLTGNGTSDDHYGQGWSTQRNNWVTSAWAASTGQAALLAALAAGQAWCGSMSAFAGGALNLLVDGSCPMGSVSVSSLTTRQLAVSATGAPAGGSVSVLQGAVDYAGTSAPSPNTQVIASYTAAALAGAGGQVTLPVEPGAGSFLRAEVLDSAGTVIATSNPVWLLQSPPPGGIPAPRQA